MDSQSYLSCIYLIHHNKLKPVTLAHWFCNLPLYFSLAFGVFGISKSLPSIAFNTYPLYVFTSLENL